MVTPAVPLNLFSSPRAVSSPHDGAVETDLFTYPAGAGARRLFWEVKLEPTVEKLITTQIVGRLDTTGQDYIQIVTKCLFNQFAGNYYTYPNNHESVNI